MIIGVTGTDGAGKGAAVDFLVRKCSCAHYSSRATLEAAVREQGREPTRDQLRGVANELRATYGNDVVVARALAQIKQHTHTCSVIESIRTLAEAETLHSAGGILLAVDADPAERYRRISGRKSVTDAVSYETFLEQEQQEMSDTNPHGMQKAAVMQRADYTIMNNGSLPEFWRKLRNFVKHHGLT
jgi:dephospho-CoA kinase